MAATTTTTKTKRKATPRVKRITIDEAEEIKIQALADAKAEWDRDLEEKRAKEIEDEVHGSVNFGEAYNEADYDDPNEHGSPLDLNSPENMIDEVNEDIFDYVETNFAKKGVPVLYQVKRNGTIVGSLEPPCSWSMLQQDYGGGHYTVKAIHAITKQYIKTQTQSVAAPLQKEEFHHEPAPTPIIQAPQDSSEVLKILTNFIMQDKELKIRNTQAEDRSDRKNSEGINSGFITMITENSRTTQEMFSKMQDNTSRMIEKMNDNFTRSMEKQEDRTNKMFDKLADLSKDKKPDIGPLELIRMMNDSRAEGQDLMQTVMDMVEAKTPEPSEDNSSLVGTLAKTMIPLFAAAAKAPAPAPQQRGAARPPQQQIAPPQTAQPQGTTGNRPAPQATIYPEQTNNAGAQPRGTGSQKVIRKNSLGLPVYADTPDKIINPTLDEDFIGGAAQPNPAMVNEQEPTELDNMYDGASMAQKTIAMIAIPLIGEGIMNPALTPGDCAGNAMSVLQSQGFSPKVVLEEFTFDFMMGIAGGFGLGEDHKPWFDEFYKTIVLIGQPQATEAKVVNAAPVVNEGENIINADIQSNTGDDVIGGTEPSLS